MSTLAAIVLGILIGWLIEWVIDWIYWRKRRIEVHSAERVAEVSLQDKATTILLQDKTAENETLHQEIAGLKARVEQLTHVPDDLKVIKGIGPEIERRLHAAGVTSFAQLAEMAPTDLEVVLGSLIKRLANEEDILNQARALARKN